MLYISYQNFRSYLKFGTTFAYYERRWLCLKYQFVVAFVERPSSATLLLGPGNDTSLHPSGWEVVTALASTVAKPGESPLTLP